MPTYEYECLSCQHRFEVFQSMTDKPIGSCPRCGKKVRRLIHGGMGVIFKGSGFYSTDNRNGGRNGSRKSPADSVPASEKTSSGGDTSAAKDSSSAQKKETAKSKT